jgi:hypothetical protein
VTRYAAYTQTGPNGSWVQRPHELDDRAEEPAPKIPARVRPLRTAAAEPADTTTHRTTDMNMLKFKTGFLKATDLTPGVIIEATIAAVSTFEFEDSGEIKPTLEFEEDQVQDVVLNQTRLEGLIEAFGVQSENWVGRMIGITQGETRYAGKKVACIELVLPPKAPQLEAAQPAPKIGGPGSEAPQSPLDRKLDALAKQYDVDPKVVERARAKGKARIQSGKADAPKGPAVGPNLDDPIPFGG